MPHQIRVKIHARCHITWTRRNQNACFVKIHAQLASIRLVSVRLAKSICYYSKMAASQNAQDLGSLISEPKNASSAYRLVRHASH